MGAYIRMADPGKKAKMPWGMKIDGLKPGAKETITDKKLKTFAVGKHKKSRLQKVCAKQMIQLCVCVRFGGGDTQANA